MGYPPSWDKCDRICREVQQALAAAGIPVPTTHTMLDEPRGPAPLEGEAYLEFIDVTDR